VIAAFPELHQDVEQAHLVRLASTIHYVNVLHQDLCVPDDSNINVIVIQPSVLWRCQLGGRKDFRPVKTEWWGAGVVICLERGADLHMA